MTGSGYRCPKCRGTLDHSHDAHIERWSSSEAYICRACAQTFPVIAGIVDFRVYADPYIDLDADRAKALRLAQQAERLSFAELVAFYYSITPEVPPDLAKYYLNHHLAGTVRGTGLFERMELSGLRTPAPSVSVLDLGCGTGGFIGIAAKTGAQVTGVDIAFRWLVVARKRMQELGIKNVDLVCACADYLPFADDSFDVVVAENLIEHVRNQTELFCEIGRIRRGSSSSLYARTVNRFAFGPEPHVGVWGVGYLPRSFQNAFVKKIRGIPYEHIYLQSFAELHSSIKKSGQSDLRVSAPKLAPSDYQHHTFAKRKFFELYKNATSNPFLRPFVTRIGPYLDIVSEAQTPPVGQVSSKHLAITRY